MAQLDGVPWYETSNIPIGVELIDFTAVEPNKAIDVHGQEQEQYLYYLSDYTAVDGSMTFSYIASIWTYIGFYDSSHNTLNTIYVYEDGTIDSYYNQLAHGTLSGAKLPSGVAYVRIGSPGNNSNYMSLIRTA